jgi:hypothetical protein
MELIIGLAYLVGMLALLVVVGRRVARFVRMVPPAPLATPDTSVQRRRLVRVVVGLVQLVGLAHMIVAACHGREGFSRDLPFLWGCAALAAVAAACVAPFVVRFVQTDAWATSSIVLPVVGLALLLPISLHAVAFRCVHASWASLDDWCGASVVGAGIAHLVFATLFCVRAVSLARTGSSPVSVSELFLLTTLASAIPFFILAMGITAATGLAILPVIALVDWLARREHAALSVALPRAIVTPCRA